MKCARLTLMGIDDRSPHNSWYGTTNWLRGRYFTRSGSFTSRPGKESHLPRAASNAPIGDARERGEGAENSYLEVEDLVLADQCPVAVHAVWAVRRAQGRATQTQFTVTKSLFEPSDCQNNAWNCRVSKYKCPTDR